MALLPSDRWWVTRDLFSGANAFVRTSNGMVGYAFDIPLPVDEANLPNVEMVETLDALAQRLGISVERGLHRIAEDLLRFHLDKSKTTFPSNTTQESPSLAVRRAELETRIQAIRSNGSTTVSDDANLLLIDCMLELITVLKRK